MNEGGQGVEAARAVGNGRSQTTAALPARRLRNVQLSTAPARLGPASGPGSTERTGALSHLPSILGGAYGLAVGAGEQKQPLDR